MIVRTKKGYKVVAHSGKALSRDDLTMDQAEKRLRQVEQFKNMFRGARRKKSQARA